MRLTPDELNRIAAAPASAPLWQVRDAAEDALEACSVVADLVDAIPPELRGYVLDEERFARAIARARAFIP